MPVTDGLLALADPRSGFCSTPVRLPVGASPLAPVVCACTIARLDLVLANADCESVLREDGSAPLYGVGHRDTYTEAAAIAVAEAAERYAAACMPSGEPRWATASQLGASALDLDTLPRVSSDELGHADCPLVLPPDPGTAIRWTGAQDLLGGRTTWVPTVMVALGLPVEPVERFWHQTSSGCSVHTDPAAAALNAILELVERDAVAAVWLQSMPIPRLNPTALSERVRAEMTRRSARGIDTVLLDATTDVGVPVVYAVEVSPGSALPRHVAAACAPDVNAAVTHALAELSGSRRTILTHPGSPDQPRQCRAVVDGAAFLRDHATAEAFEFLTAERPDAAQHRPIPGDTATELLAAVLDRLRGVVREVLLVDITTTELHQAGLVAVRAIVPDLMPISFDHRARYLATPRLYELPARLCFPVHDERDVNPLPQPFA